MRIENIEVIEPKQDMVVVDIAPKETEGLYLGGDEKSAKFKIELYHGIVEALGPLSTEAEHCPNLKIGDTAIFSQFAGSHIASSDDKFHKIIRGYDIMATTTDSNNLNVNTLEPTADRLLITVLASDVTEDGLYLSESDARDPNLQDISYGIIEKIGPSTKEVFDVGDLVGYDIHAGEEIRAKTSEASPELRVIREDSILFIKR